MFFIQQKILPSAAWTNEDNKVIFAMKKGLDLVVTGESSEELLLMINIP